jgi:D-arginine utilization repressor
MIAKSHFAMLESVAKLFHPYVETVMHDLESGTIAAIYNNLSKRTVGEPSAVTEFVGMRVDEFPDVFEPYYKANWDGKQFKCVSITIRSKAGKPVGLACVNFDTSAFQTITASIDLLLGVINRDTPNPIEQFTEDWQTRVNKYIGNYLQEHHTTLSAMSKAQKRDAANHLYSNGLFNYRGAANYIAAQMHVSRATIYNYLKEGN